LELIGNPTLKDWNKTMDEGIIELGLETGATLEIVAKGQYCSWFYKLSNGQIYKSAPF
jgi:hypothetical protein